MSRWQFRCGKCGCHGEVTRNPPSACPKCRAPIEMLQPHQGPNRRARRVLKAWYRKHVAVDTQPPAANNDDKSS